MPKPSVEFHAAEFPRAGGVWDVSANGQPVDILPKVFSFACFVSLFPHRFAVMERLGSLEQLNDAMLQTERNAQLGRILVIS